MDTLVFAKNISIPMVNFYIFLIKVMFVLYSFLILYFLIQDPEETKPKCFSIKFSDLFHNFINECIEHNTQIRLEKSKIHTPHHQKGKLSII